MAAQILVRPFDQIRRIEVSVSITLLVLAAVVATWPAWTGYAIVFDGVFLIVASCLVARGYALADERYINLGLGSLGIGLFTRYVGVSPKYFVGHLTLDHAKADLAERLEGLRTWRALRH